jgi:hypothetical protein
MVIEKKVAEVSAAELAYAPKHVPINQGKPELPPKVALTSVTSTSAVLQIASVCAVLDHDLQSEPHPGLRFPRKGTIPSA